MNKAKIKFVLGMIAVIAMMAAFLVSESAESSTTKPVTLPPVAARKLVVANKNWIECFQFRDLLICE